MLRELRKNSGYTIKQTSLSVGVSEGYMSQLETGSRSPSPELAEKLSKLYKCELDLILIASGHMPDWFLTVASDDPVRTLNAAKDKFRKYAPK